MCFKSYILHRFIFSYCLFIRGTRRRKNTFLTHFEKFSTLEYSNLKFFEKKKKTIELHLTTSNRYLTSINTFVQKKK